MKRIQFFRVKQKTHLSLFLQQQLQLDESAVAELIEIGAIYCNFVRVTEDQTVLAEDLLRCHTQPRRFLTDINWQERIIFCNDDFLVVDKPAGLPCQASLDNRIENVYFQLSRHLNQNLFITHRLDIGTRGLVVLARNQNFQSQFNQILENRQALKIYEALALGPLLMPGAQTHWMRPAPRAPKILSRSAVENWKICQMEILKSEILIPTPTSDPAVARGINFYRLRLDTGRTHQIRAQLSFEQNPILGDSLYGGLAHTLPFEWQALQCSGLSFRYHEKDYHWEIPSLRASYAEAILRF